MNSALLSLALLAFLDFGGIDGPSASPLNFDDPAPGRPARSSSALYLRTPEADPVAVAQLSAWMRETPVGGTVAVLAPASSPPAPAPPAWSRTDSRGVRWTHADRSYLDSYVDGVERSYAAPAPAPAVGYGAVYGSACANGSCSVQAAPAMRPGFRLFGRR